MFKVILTSVLTPSVHWKPLRSVLGSHLHWARELSSTSCLLLNQASVQFSALQFVHSHSVFKPRELSGASVPTFNKRKLQPFGFQTGHMCTWDLPTHTAFSVLDALSCFLRPIPGQDVWKLEAVILPGKAPRRSLLERNGALEVAFGVTCKMRCN